MYLQVVIEGKDVGELLKEKIKDKAREHESETGEISEGQTEDKATCKAAA